MWFDSHCHLDFPAFDPDRAEVMARARAAQVEAVFVPGVRRTQWPRLLSLREQHPGVCVGVGLHPSFVHELSEQQTQDALDELPQWHRRVGAVAIGECGLDARSAKSGGADLDRQQRVFEAHIEIARRLEVPLVLHVVHAHGRALDVLERCKPPGGVLHSYSGPAELVPRYAALGLHFGFCGMVTRPRAKKVRAALCVVPAERLLIETDAPDQSPHDFSGSGPDPRRNEPAAVLRVAATMAQLRGVPQEELAELTTRNARALYGV